MHVVAGCCRLKDNCVKSSPYMLRLIAPLPFADGKRGRREADIVLGSRGKYECGDVDEKETTD